MLLLPGKNCQRVERADRVALLMENAAYFRAVHAALQRAKRSILLLGWQFDPRTRLVPEIDGHERGGEIGHLLRRLVRETPELKVRLLIWRSPLPIAWSQSFFPQRALAWFRNKAIDFRLDRARPLGACHHQKVLVIDDRLAFCGGGDISVDRWDTAAHPDHDRLRSRPSGIPCPPRHEVMAMVDGAAARMLGDLARQRWFEATGERIGPVEEGGDPWPEEVRPDLHATPAGLARTEPAWRGHPGVRESETLHLDAIARARRSIYLENQYLTSPLIAAALAARLEEPHGPEIVVVSTAKSPSWFDRATMDGARRSLLQRLRAADRYGRLSAWKPLTPGGDTIIVHSKVTIIDDCLLRVGSTNLNNRSGGFDTEADVAFVANSDGDGTSAFIAGFRARLLSHFLGVEVADFEAAYAETGAVAGAIEALNRKGRLAPLNEPASGLSRLMAEWQLGDPTSPADSWRPWRRGRLSRMLRRSVAHAQAAEEAALAASITKSTINGR